MFAGQIAKTIIAGRGLRVTALVNKDETHEGRLGRGRIRDLDREEKPHTVQTRFSPEGHG